MPSFPAFVFLLMLVLLPRTLLSHFHVLTLHQGQAPVPAPAPSPPVPCCSHETTPQIPTMTGMELTFRPWLPSEFHYCPCAGATLPVGCSQSMIECDRNTKAGPFLGAPDKSDGGFGPRTSKAWPKRPWAAHTSTHPRSLLPAFRVGLAWWLAGSPRFFQLPPHFLKAGTS